MEPAVKPAVERHGKHHKRVLVAATPLTLKEEKLKNLIARVDNEHIVDLISLPELVKFAEDYRFDDAGVRSYLENELSAVDPTLYSTVVLGCTHFIYFKNLFRQILPRSMDIIDGNFGTVRNLQNIMRQNNLQESGSGSVTYYISGRLVENSELLDRYDLLHRMLDLQ
jgi:glutamate racemase